MLDPQQQFAAIVAHPVVAGLRRGAEEVCNVHREELAPALQAQLKQLR